MQAQKRLKILSIITSNKRPANFLLNLLTKFQTKRIIGSIEMCC